MAGRLQGKVALVTGAGTGIGEAIAKLFAREGAKVVVSGRESDPVEAVAGEIKGTGGEAVAVMGDLSTEQGAHEAVRAATTNFGGLDILISNAGVLPEQAKLENSTTEHFEQIVKDNIATTYFVTRAAWPELTKTKGNVVFAGSEAGLIGEPQIATYSGSKAWIMAFMRSIAMEGTMIGVRANAIAPGPINTEMTDPATGAINQQFSKEIESGTPMGRRGTPEEVANGYLFLASDEASYVTGTVLSVDGGSAVGKGALGEKVPSSLKELPPVSLDLKHQFAGDPDKK